MFEKRKSQPNNRRDQVVLNRLRIGHSNVTHIHLITKENKKKCLRCDSDVTIKHLFIDCPMYNLERINVNLPKDLKECLNNTEKTVNFLKLVDYYNLI